MHADDNYDVLPFIAVIITINNVCIKRQQQVGQNGQCSNDKVENKYE